MPLEPSFENKINFFNEQQVLIEVKLLLSSDTEMLL